MSGRRERAVWGSAEEQVLLELFRRARNNPQMRSERGVKARGWATIEMEINQRCNRNFDKDQLKSKYARIMQEYDLYKSIGADQVPLEDIDWDREIMERPRSVSILKQFRENGFAHAVICSCITGDKTDDEDVEPLEMAPESAIHAGIKRELVVDDAELEMKKLKAEGKKERASWQESEESLMLFLYLRAKNDPDVRSERGIRGRGWVEVITDFNKQTGHRLDKDQIKSKFTRIMSEYDQFKTATGFSGIPGTAPKSDEDWENLMRDRPKFLLQLRMLRGFRHVELCSLIAGDTPTEGLKQASLSDFIASGALLVPDTPADAAQPMTLSHVQIQQLPNTVSVAPQQPLVVMSASTSQPSGANPANTSSLDSTPTAVSIAASSLPFLLPATAASLAAQGRTNQTGAAAAAAAADSSPPQDPNFFTPELRDNLNTFLKTATAYLEMLMNDRNEDNDF